MDPLTLDVSSLGFGSPTKLGNSQQQVIPMTTVPGKFGWDTRLTLQLGKDQSNMLSTQYGIGTPLPQTDPNRRNLDLVLTPELEKVLRALDARVVEHASKNSEELFKTKTLMKQHTPLVRERDDGTPFVRVKVNVNADGADGGGAILGRSSGPKETEVRAFNADRTKVRRCDYTSISRNALVIAVADTPGVWFNMSQFGVSLTARSIIVKSEEQKDGLGMFNLLPGVTEEEDDVAAPASPPSGNGLKVVDAAPEETKDDVVSKETEGTVSAS